MFIFSLSIKKNKKNYKKDNFYCAMMQKNTEKSIFFKFSTLAAIKILFSLYF